MGDAQRESEFTSSRHDTPPYMLRSQSRRSDAQRISQLVGDPRCGSKPVLAGGHVFRSGSTQGQQDPAPVVDVQIDGCPLSSRRL